MGKAYANKKKIENRPLNDYYPTPKALTRELIRTGELDDVQEILEPACGEGAIVSVLEENGFKVVGKDIMNGDDFMNEQGRYECIVTNPPFKLWDAFVEKAKSISNKVIMIGRTNYFGSHSRNVNGIWDHLKTVYVFDRQVAYDREAREDEKMYCGCLVTGWFVWDNSYNGKPTIEVIDVQEHIYKKD